MFPVPSPACSFARAVRAAPIVLALIPLTLLIAAALPRTAAAQSVPGTPTEIQIAGAHRQFRVSWIPPASDGGSPITQYEVCIIPERAGAVSPRRCQGMLTLASPPPALKTTPDPNGNFRTEDLDIPWNTDFSPQRIAVRARNAIGASPFSESIVGSAVPDLPPGAPRGTIVTGAGRELRVDWQPPTNLGNVPMRHYEICTLDSFSYTTAAEFDPSLCRSDRLVIVTTLDVNPAGLIRGVIERDVFSVYQVAVRAVNEAGPGPFGDHRVGEAGIDPSIGPPRLLRARGGTDAIVAEWQPPVLDNADVDATITGYAICATPVGIAYSPLECPSENVIDDSIGADARTFDITGLEGGVRYNIRMRTNSRVISTSTPVTSQWSLPLIARAGHAPDAPLPEILPDVATAILDSTIRGITNRIGAVDAGDCSPESPPQSLSDSLARALAHNGDADGGIDLGESFKRAFNGSAMALVGSSGNCAVASGGVWGSGSYSNLSGDRNDFDWDGELFNLQIGADTRLDNDAVAGAAASWSGGKWDYTLDGVAGTQRMQLRSLHPYLAGRAGHADLWGSVGFGSGDLQTEDADGNKAPSADVAMRSITVGAAVDASRLASSAKRARRTYDGGRFRAKGELQAMRMDVDYAADSGIGDLEIESRRTRAAMEWVENPHTTERGTTQNSIEGGLRYDSGDGGSGTGFEIALRSSHDNHRGTSASMRARVLVAHSGGRDEWGVSGIIRHAPGADGQGLQWTVEPSWGDSRSGIDRLWRDGVADQTQPAPDALLSTELGYGIAYRAGMMTPHINLQLHDSGGDYRVGVRYRVALRAHASPLTTGVEAYRNEGNESEVAETGVLFKVGIAW